MRVQVLQHVAFEGLGSITHWLEARQAQVSFCRFFEDGYALPQVDALDLLIVLGGPMSVNDEADLPWLIAEKAFVADCIAAGKPVLGICLGAQLIAASQGAKVYSGTQKEIGWWPIQAVGAPEGCFRFPEALAVFHWHGETFDLPKGAVHLARSQACTHQAFQLGERVLGLQFHLETTPATAEALWAECADELTAAAGQPFVQSAEQMQQVSAETYQGVNQLMGRILDWLVRA